MSLSHEEYRRTTVNLLPSQELFIDHEVTRKHTTKKQVITDLIAIGIEVAKGRDLDEFYGEKIRQNMIEVGQESMKSINKEIHDTLFKTFYKALRDRFASMEQHIVAIALMLSAFLSDVQENKEGSKMEDIYNSYLNLAEKKIQIRNEKQKSSIQD